MWREKIVNLEEGPLAVAIAIIFWTLFYAMIATVVIGWPLAMFFGWGGM
jgi:hypothetical protein